jgi:hypothetical protein
MVVTKKKTVKPIDVLKESVITLTGDIRTKLEKYIIDFELKKKKRKDIIKDLLLILISSVTTYIASCFS